MRVLFVHQYLGALGGAEANIHLTAKELQKRGHITALAYGSGTGRSEEQWRETFRRSFRWGQQGKREALPYLVQFRPDLIYLHNINDLELLEALTKSGLPLVRMVHDHEMYCLRGYKYNPFTRQICRRPVTGYCVFPCLAPLKRNRAGRWPFTWASYAAKQREVRLNQRCHRFVVYSQYSRDELVRNGFDAAKIEIHVPLRCWGSRGQTSTFSERNLILYAGQIIRGKGVDFLLHALAKVSVPFEGIILGEGNHRAACERLSARLGLAQRVQFRGFVRREDLKQFYLEASVFAVSSVWPEPFGLVGPEAMRYGLPVVAFDAGGIREWLQDGENGYLVPRMDTDLFARRITELLQNKELARQMGERGLQRVNQEYDSAKQVAALEKTFLRLVNEAQPQGRCETIHAFAD